MIVVAGETMGMDWVVCPLMAWGEGIRVTVKSVYTSININFLDEGLWLDQSIN